MSKTTNNFNQTEYYRVLKDPMSLVAVTDIDICKESINYALGAANVGYPHVSIISLSKCLPDMDELSKKEVYDQLLMRACKLAVHELCHTIGL